MRAPTPKRRLEVGMLPVHLRWATHPGPCGSGCWPEHAPGCPMPAWSKARRQWCEAHGYSVYELLVAEEMARQARVGRREP